MSDEVWFLAKEDQVPEDYKTVNISSTQVDDPEGTKRMNADGTCTPAQVWLVDLERGGVTVQSDRVWSHHPPLDVVIHHLETEDFKRLLGRLRGSQDHALGDTGAPPCTTPVEGGLLGNKFREK